MAFKCDCQIDAKTFDFQTVPLDCPRTWQMLSSGLTKGIFQLEKSLGKEWSKKAKPKNIEELAALISILRPGPLESGHSELYIERKHGIKQVEYLHISLKPILKETYGTLIYQEQVLQIARDIAGFSLEEADILRKGIGKKDPKVVAKCRIMFMEKCKEKNIVNEEQADEIFDWIEKGQRYIFNKCISSDTIIRRGSGKHYIAFTVAELYKIRNDIQYAKNTGHLSLYKKWKLNGHYGYGLSLCKNYRIKPNIIQDIQHMGIRDIYEIKLENGVSIKTTINHKFPTSEGIKTCGQLAVEDYLYICGKYEEPNWKKMNSFSGKSQDPSGKKYKGHNGFPKGNANPGYVDGSYSQFIMNKSKLEKKCKICGICIGRLEVDHIDKNRANNSLDNLQILCSSCHKKKEYQTGRIKKGGKGYPSTLVKIHSIKKVGQDEVYDITMQGPNHNFVTDSGIVTCNSHAVGYAMTSYKTAYCKAHFPLEFFTSYLSFASYKQKPREEIYELVQDARYFNIQVTPPNIAYGNIDFMTKDGGILFGLSHIKGIGRSAIKAIVKKNIELKTWNDFLKNVPVLHRNVAAALIKSGACDSYGKSRNRMLKELFIVLGDRVLNEEGKWKNITGFSKKERGFFLSNYRETHELGGFIESMIDEKVPQKSRIPVLEKRITLLKEEDKDSNTQKALAEKHYLGIPLSCSVVDDVEQKGTHTCLQAAKELNRTDINICGVIEKIKITKTRNGKNPGQTMCFLTVADATYSIDSIVVFPNLFDDIKHFLKEDTIVSIEGEKRDRSIICSEIHKIL